VSFENETNSHDAALLFAGCGCRTAFAWVALFLTVAGAFIERAWFIDVFRWLGLPTIGFFAWLSIRASRQGRR